MISQEYLPTIQIIFWAITALGVWLSWLTFKANQKIKRAEWLKSLYEKFYESDLYKEVRKWIDFERLDAELSNDPGNVKEEKLTDFLNFFEFIASLEKMKQLKIDEIQDLFSYYLTRIRQSEKLMAYIRQYEFKNLDRLLYQSFSNVKKG
jgi:hypothetical protein